MTEISTIELEVIAEEDGSEPEIERAPAPPAAPPEMPAEEIAVASLPSGEVTGLTDLRERYELLSKLGSGGMADVFLAVQSGSEHMERFAVLKRMRALSELRDSATRMFTNEARVIASLNHPHIVKVFDFGHLDGDIAIAMEYIDGESLEALQHDLRAMDEKVPLPVALKLLTEAAEALHYAHAATGADGRPLHLIHRDIGPQNLLLTSHGYLKVIDFGVAKTAVNPMETTPGLVKGKMPYFAPETLTGPKVDGRADLYALGLVMYELLTLERAHPFKTDASIAEVVQRITTVQLPSLTSLDERIPQEVSDVVNKATSIKPADRFQTGAEFAAAIRAAGDATTGVATTAQVEDWFQSTFTERFARRRAFERRALERKAAESANRQTRVLQSHPEIPSIPAEPAAPRRRRLLPVAMFAAVFIGLIGGTALAYTLFASEDVAQPAATTPTANLFVNSEPADAEIVIDGHRLGSTGTAGLYMYLQPEQVHELSVEKAGYQAYRLQVTGEEFALRRIVAKLLPGQPAVGTAPEAERIDEPTPVATLQTPRVERRRTSRSTRGSSKRKTAPVVVAAPPPEKKPAPAPVSMAPVPAATSAPVEAKPVEPKPVAPAPAPAAPEPVAPVAKQKKVAAEVRALAAPVVAELKALAEPKPTPETTSAPANTTAAVVSASSAPVPAPAAKPAPVAVPAPVEKTRPRRDPLPVIPVRSAERKAPVASAPVVARAPVKQSMKTLMARRNGGQNPKYPRRELEEGIPGTVTLTVRVGPDGRLAEHKIIDGPRSFRKAVERVVKSWRFRPHFVDGQPVQTTGTLKIHFEVGG